MKKNRHTQGGFSLVTTIFILVILVLLGSFMVTLVQTQNQSANLSILGARADMAAASGLEWATKKALADGACTNVAASLTFPGLNGFSVATTCEGPYAIDEGANNYNVYELTAEASYGSWGQPDFVSRRKKAYVRDA